MNSAEKQTVLHCLKSMIDEAVCEECPLYGITGTDHCEKDCVRLAINTLEQEPCTDAISRQAVLEAIEDDNRNAHYSCFASNYDAQCFKDIIKELPPVTPQYTDAEIQKMQDLEFAEIQKAYEIGKEEGSSKKPNKWIPVSERYPEDGQRVLVDYCDEDAGIMLMRFNVNGYRGFKAWMPLPERYKASPAGSERSDKDG